MSKYRIGARWNLTETIIEPEFIEADSVADAIAKWVESDAEMIEDGLEMDNLVLSINKV